MPKHLYFIINITSYNVYYVKLSNKLERRRLFSAPWHTTLLIIYFLKMDNRYIPVDLLSRK